jgi:hypothetical protein
MDGGTRVVAINTLLLIQIVVCAFAWWLGLYLLARNARRASLRYAGLGIVAYALGLGCTLVSEQATPAASATLARVGAVLLLVPAACWAGAALELTPPDAPLRQPFLTAWRNALVPILVLLLVLGSTSDLLLTFADGEGRAGPAYLPVALVLWLPLLAAAVLMARLFFARQLGKRTGPVLAVLVLFALSTALLVAPLEGVPRSLAILTVGIDLALLDLAIVFLDAFDEGETLVPDILRSFTAAAGTALLFGGQLALALAAGLPLSGATLALLLATIGSAIALTTLATPLQTLLDRLVFSHMPGLQRARSDLRAAADMLPRIDPGLDLAQLDDAELARVTRRALSHYGDLPRLAANPLTRLPGLVRHDGGEDPLERAAALKALLADSIHRLKPPTGDFGTSDEWRYYNALYFPYVVGLKPYSRRPNGEHLDDTARRALDWFQTSVPERTLYNWQTAAARLVAQDLRARQLNRERETPLHA